MVQREYEKGISMRKGRSRVARAGRLLVWGLAVAAVVQELRKPADEREWNGTVAGFVPYDYRPPTLERARERLWNPQGPLVSPQVFGVGWSVNFGKLVALAKQRAA
jgi:hypothetical protein